MVKNQDCIVNHRRSHPSPHIIPTVLVISFEDRRREDIGGFGVESRLGEGSEKRGGTRSKARKKSGVCGVREWLEKKGKWRDTSAQVVIFLCS